MSCDGSSYAGSTKPTTAGNGALMRLAPVLMYYYPDQSLMTKYSIKSAQVTHGADECLQANQLFSQIICRAFNNNNKESILFNEFMMGNPSGGVQTICNGTYRSGEVQGTGHVVDSLAAALWCFYSTDTFKDAVLKAANLGDDADTTAAICGQISGAYYGIKSIPNHWLEYLFMYDEIINISNKIYFSAHPIP
ncbi:MAG TPA: ADP-ribosylglycohydrolase family protein [Methyloprofundus sp.]|uniref:ADP-ribosylglycohydrolase family protein n=1 Tax=Methyloprofundus sp. TaxID=2020875 RepID=UPI0017CD9D5A|nr:ADP-ribosylglycohydrolase family protein [Methyloprofundus sp.]HIG64769.1 ADP-ribosylglycohydrolase family protein [Methyloprofundus sp.]HIL77902.1 ADP-ribosylglycohydrolase family protein [Methylococcales bacterium]